MSRPLDVKQKLSPPPPGGLDFTTPSGWTAAQLPGLKLRVLHWRQLFVRSGSETPRSLDPLVAVMVVVTKARDAEG